MKMEQRTITIKTINSKLDISTMEVMAEIVDDNLAIHKNIDGNKLYKYTVTNYHNGLEVDSFKTKKEGLDFIKLLNKVVDFSTMTTEEIATYLVKVGVYKRKENLKFILDWDMLEKLAKKA